MAILPETLAHHGALLGKESLDLSLRPLDGDHAGQGGRAAQVIPIKTGNWRTDQPHVANNRRGTFERWAGDADPGGWRAGAVPLRMAGAAGAVTGRTGGRPADPESRAGAQADWSRWAGGTGAGYRALYAIAA